MSKIPTDTQWQDLADRIIAGENVIEEVQLNGTALTVTNKAVNVTALSSTTKYGATLELTMDSSTYVLTATLKDQDGNTLGTAQTVDLPLETMVVSGSYDSTNKKVILTLKNGNTVEFSVADLVSGLQTELSATNKLDAAYIDYSNTSDSTTLSGSGAPTTSTVGKLGQFYVDTATGNFYICTAVSGSTYTWTLQDGTTYSDFTGAAASTAGTHGLVPAPAAGDNTKFLCGDGTWTTASYTLPAATTTTLGGVIVGDGLTVDGNGTIAADTFTTAEWNALWA